ncbi:hypothetical protein C1H46_006398 [Malus baccata]|uniref:Uncharacterized protein n=1 Tax=Malus baccata TaxID=106549 RepID=A0A540NBX2_MALBA|nr:hypothetical protein C1H46_006398 [Malus baccata]
MGEKENERMVGVGGASALVDPAEGGCAGVEFWVVVCGCCCCCIVVYGTRRCSGSFRRLRTQRPISMKLSVLPSLTFENNVFYPQSSLALSSARPPHTTESDYFPALNEVVRVIWVLEAGPQRVD